MRNVSRWAEPFTEPEDEDGSVNVTPGKRRRSPREQLDAMRDEMTRRLLAGRRQMKWGAWVLTVGFFGAWLPWHGFFWIFFTTWIVGMIAVFGGWYTWRLAKVQLSIDPREFY